MENKRAQEAALRAAELRNSISCSKAELSNLLKEFEPFANTQKRLLRRLSTELGSAAPYNWERIARIHDKTEITVEGAGASAAIRCSGYSYESYSGDYTYEDSFIISPHIMNGEPEKLEGELREEAKEYVREQIRKELADKELKIAELRKEISDLEKRELGASYD